MFARAVLGFAAISCLLALTSASNAQQLKLDELRDLHRASRESIRTLVCQVDLHVQVFNQTPPVEQACSGRFWHNVDGVRGKVKDGNEYMDRLWKDSVRIDIRTRVANGKTEVGASKVRAVSRHADRCDPFTRGLLIFNVPETVSDVPLEELLTLASKARLGKTVSNGTQSLVGLDLAFDAGEKRKNSWTVEIQLDPALNYLAKRTVYTASSANGTFRRVAEVLEFSEVLPGVFFPIRVQGQSTDRGKKWSAFTARLTNIRINEPLPDDIFQVRYPPGIFLSDGIRGEVYQVDADGNAISESRPMGKVPPPPLGVAQGSGTETKNEATSWTRWILPVSLGLLAIAGMIAAIRRWPILARLRGR